MARHRLVFTALAASLLIFASPVSARKLQYAAKAAVDPSCPVDKNGRPDKACAEAAPELTKVNCPASMSDIDCDYYRQGYGAALEDNRVMSGTERGIWKSDVGDDTAYKSGYEAGWRKTR